MSASAVAYPHPEKVIILNILLSVSQLRDAFKMSATPVASFWRALTGSAPLPQYHLTWVRCKLHVDGLMHGCIRPFT